MENIRSLDEQKELMEKVGKQILKVVKENATDEEAALSVAAMLIKYSCGLMRGVMTDEEVVQTLLYSAEQLKTNVVIIPNDTKYH